MVLHINVSLVYGARIPVTRRNNQWDYSQVVNIAKKLVSKEYFRKYFKKKYYRHSRSKFHEEEAKYADEQENEDDSEEEQESENNREPEEEPEDDEGEPDLYDYFYDNLQNGIVITGTPYILKSFISDEEDACAFIILREYEMEVLDQTEESPKEVDVPTTYEISKFENFLDENNIPSQYKMYMVISGQ